MGRVLKQNGSHESTNAKRVTQGKSTQGDMSSYMNNSPHMIAQRKKLQGLFGGAAQLQGAEDEILPGALQKKTDEEMPQLKAATTQRQEEKDEAQLKSDATIQRLEKDDEVSQPKFASEPAAQREQQPAAKSNNTDLPDNLKFGIENLSGMSMDHVNVHYNSSQPAQLNALAYAQGSDIHIAPGQEQHLPHEAWHVVQQAQGRVQPTMQMKDGVPVNDDKSLEHEADVMGGKALSVGQQGASGRECFFGGMGGITKASRANNLLLTQRNATLEPSEIFRQQKLGFYPPSFPQNTAQLKGTVITHTPGTIPFAGKNYMIGLKMVAKLDPEEVVTGSATTADNYDFMKGIRAYYGAAGVIRGHLLNHDLGGYGVPENLYPISSMANSQHSDRVEQNVKGALFDSAKNTKNDINYQVVVAQNGPSWAPFERADFRCQWSDENSNIYTDVINSQLNIDNGWGGKSASAKKSPTKWRHGKRRGEENFGDKVSAKKIAIDPSLLGPISLVDYDALKKQTIDSKGISDVQDWAEAVKMLANELDELGAVADPSNPPAPLIVGNDYLLWLNGEIDKATKSNQLDVLTVNEGARMMSNLIAIRKERIFIQDGVDTESNISEEEADVEMD